MKKAVWTPSRERIDKSHMMRFLRSVAGRRAEVTDYPSLYRWSVREPLEFWPEVWEFCEIEAARKWDQPAKGYPSMPGTRWFPGSRLNFAANLLKEAGTHPALISWNEEGRRGEISYPELRKKVSSLSRSLLELGIRPGDRIAGFLPNIPETVIAMLATTAIGAIWSSCSPDFGARAVLDRFGQIRPRLLFVATSYRYAGKVIDLRERISSLLPQLPSVEKLIVVPHLEKQTIHSGQLEWEELLRPGESSSANGNASGGEPGLEFPVFPFDHPVYVLYSSGTTGLPKCLIHGAGGTLIQHLKELVLHTNLSPGDRIFYYTTCGWMMWNWLVSSLAVGATVVLYDGSPFHPDDSILFQMAAEEGVQVFGTSAKYLALAEKKGLSPARRQNLSALRTILSTGSPLAPRSFDYVATQIGQDIQVASISGGTDLISCFALGNPIAPVYRGELQTRGLGMAVEIFDEEGQSIVGRPGELVCRKPFPSMPVGFWDDPDQARYRAAYFEHFPGVWRHGDWAELTETGGLIIYGRSDATLNPGGVRIGTAEIYRQVEKHEAVIEALVVAQEWEDDLRLVLFVRLREGLELDDRLRDEIRKLIRKNASPHHVPRKIIQVSDIPRTVSGKISEIAVRETIHDRPVKNRSALANPDSLKLYQDLPELRS